MIENKNKGLKLLVCLSIIAVLITVMSVVSAQVPPPENDVIVEVTPDSQTGAPGNTLMFNVTLTNNGTVPDIIVVDSITGIPAEWTVELKDAGVPQSLPYQTPLLENKTNYLLTLDVHVPADATAGATITINIYSFADISKTDSDTFDVVLGTPSPCYIATATYGTPLDSNIDVLRDFRDTALMTNPIGEAFVSTYYTTSPPIADALRENEGLKNVTRLTLITPLVYLSKSMLNGILLVFIFILGLTAVLLLRKDRRMKILKSLLVGTGAILVFIAVIFSLGFVGYAIPFCAVVGAYMLPFVIPLSVFFTLCTVLNLNIKNFK